MAVINLRAPFRNRNNFSINPDEVSAEFKAHIQSRVDASYDRSRLRTLDQSRNWMKKMKRERYGI